MASLLKITRATPDQAATLTKIAFAAKRHWGYPDRWIQIGIHSLDDVAELGVVEAYRRVKAAYPEGEKNGANQGVRKPVHDHELIISWEYYGPSAQCHRAFP
jgi:hypothetical protein